MKKILAIVAIATIVLIGCQNPSPAPTPEPPTPEKPSGKLDPNAKVYISPAAGVKSADNPKHLTAREIVEQADELVMSNGSTAIADWNRDTINNRIMGSSIWVIAQSGYLETIFVTSRDIILVTLDRQIHPVDTIAYIENAVMIEAEKQIRTAYEAEDYATCYKLFEEAFVFKPITGSEWRELKSQGKN